MSGTVGDVDVYICVDHVEHLDEGVSQGWSVVVASRSLGVIHTDRHRNRIIHEGPIEVPMHDRIDDDIPPETTYIPEYYMSEKAAVMTALVYLETHPAIRPRTILNVMHDTKTRSGDPLSAPSGHIPFAACTKPDSHPHQPEYTKHHLASLYKYIDEVTADNPITFHNTFNISTFTELALKMSKE